jgi:hypothetical protein
MEYTDVKVKAGSRPAGLGTSSCQQDPPSALSADGDAAAAAADDAAELRHWLLERARVPERRVDGTLRTLATMEVDCLGDLIDLVRLAGHALEGEGRLLDLTAARIRSALGEATAAPPSAPAAPSTPPTTTPAPALGAAADEAATTTDDDHEEAHDTAGGSSGGPTLGSSGKDTTERSRIDPRRPTGQNAPRGEEWGACHQTQASSMSIRSRATGDDGGGGCNDGGGGRDGGGGGGGGGSGGDNDGVGGHATVRRQQRKAAKRAREKARKAAARAAQAAEREARAATSAGGSASGGGGPPGGEAGPSCAKVGQRWFRPQEGSRRHSKHVVRQEAAAADVVAAAELRAQVPLDPEALFAELEVLSSVDGEYVVPPWVQRCYFQSLGEWELERLCRAVDKERAKYAVAKEAAALGKDHLNYYYPLNARALRDKHGVGGPELINVYYPKTTDDELSDDGESALNGMSLEFDGDDYEGYDEFERDKNRLLAMGVFDDGSRGYDAPPPGCGWREDW